MIIGIIGAGNIGGTLGKLWIAAGHRIAFGTPEPLKASKLAESLGSNASSLRPIEAVKGADAILVAVPFKAWPSLINEIGETLANKIVLDATNMNRERDGDIADRARAHPRGTLGFIAELLPKVRLVKTLNTIEASTLKREAHRPGEQYGVPVAGDDPEAVAVAAQLVRDAGFDPVIVGGAARAKDFDEGASVWNSPVSASDLGRMLGVS